MHHHQYRLSLITITASPINTNQSLRSSMHQSNHVDQDRHQSSQQIYRIHNRKSSVNIVQYSYHAILTFIDYQGSSLDYHHYRSMQQTDHSAHRVHHLIMTKIIVQVYKYIDYPSSDPHVISYRRFQQCWYRYTYC